MHLLFTILSLDAGGAERALSNLANYWQSKGHQVTIVTFSAPQTRPFYPLNAGINVIALNALFQPFFRRDQRLRVILERLYKLRRTFKMQKPDMIVSFIDLVNIGSLLAAIGLKIPMIISERTNPHDHAAYTPRFYRHLRTLTYPWTRHLIVQTEAAASFFPSLTAKIKIIPNVLKKPAFIKTSHTPQVTHLMTVGRLAVEKDHTTLLRAFAVLKPRYPHLRLTIYGEGRERENLHLLCQTLQIESAVQMPGTVKNIDEVLMQADLFIFPSLYEGFPNALGEAMSAGVPVVASDCSGNQALVEDRFNGRLFSVGDVSALVTVIEGLMSDQRTRTDLARNARQLSETFAPHRIYNLWDEVIANIK